MDEVALPWGVFLSHLPRNATLCRGVLGSGVMTTGSGPCDEDLFDEFLRACGIWVTDLGESGPNVLVIGHEDWDEDELDAAIEARSGGQLKVYSQEMVIASIALGADVYLACETDELEQFGVGHPALEYLSEDYEFDWPSTDVIARPPGLVVNFGSFDSPETGLLRHMGYAVGKTNGLPEGERRRILEDVMGRRLLPASKADEFYLDQWGEPASPERLRKTANCIASFVRLKKLDVHRDNSAAISDWESDLRWLKGKYYEHLGSRFRWPDTAVAERRPR